MRHPAFRHLIRGAAAALAAVLTAAGLAAVPAQAVTYSISGTVSIPEDAPHAWLGEVSAWVESTDGSTYEEYVDPETGAYTVHVERAGDYLVRFGPHTDPEAYERSADMPNLMPDYYPGGPYLADGEWLTVSGAVTGIDAQLDYGVTLSGRLTKSDGSSPEAAYVYVFTEEEDEFLTGWPEADGTYTITGLRPDDWYVWFAWNWYDPSDASTFTNELWNDAFAREYATLASTRDGAIDSVDGQIDKIPYMPDAYSSPFVREIEWLASTGVAKGWRAVDSYEYRPFVNVNRDVMAAFLHRMAGQPVFPKPATSTFSDVAPTHVFLAEIEWLATQGITNGWIVGDTKEFRPTTAVKRDVMAAFLYRFAGSPEFEPTTQTFVDVPPSHVFYKEIEWLATAGISRGWTVGGVKEFRPTTAVKRDVMAAFLYRFSQLPD